LIKSAWRFAALRSSARSGWNFRRAKDGQAHFRAVHSKARFEHGEATITIGLMKQRDQWQILRFDVRSHKLVPR
jgi:hypothetical protein